MFTSCACSSASARPVRLLTLVTSGIVKSLVSIFLPIRVDSPNEVPGGEKTLIVNVASSMMGKNSRPKRGIAATVNTTNNSANTTTTQRNRITKASIGRYARLIQTTTGLSFGGGGSELDASFMRCHRKRVNSKSLNTGTTVSATSSEAAIEMTTAQPSGRNILPSMPLRLNSGTKTRMIISVAKTMDDRISSLARVTTSVGVSSGSSPM